MGLLDLSWGLGFDNLSDLCSKRRIKMKATFKIYAECKHSRRYRCEDEKFPITDIYVKREFADGRDELKMEVWEGDK